MIQLYRISWGEFTKRSNNLAQALLDGGTKPGDKIAFYMRNCPEYGEGIAAGFKARLTHVNVNYRYVANELIYLMDNSDATVVVYSAEFAEQVREIRDELPGVKQWVEVKKEGQIGNDDALAYDDLATHGDGNPLDIERSPDDLLMIYTGGTTGMPKGVMWRHQDIWCATGAGGNPRIGIPPFDNLDNYIEQLQKDPAPVNLPLPPIMHGTGLVSTIGAMMHGGTCITLTERSFDAEEALAAIDAHKVTATTIVGDAFARPMVEALDANPGKYDISSLRSMNSSGVMWTRAIKAGLLRHNENLLLADAFSSSEAIGLGASVMSKDQEIEVAKFTLGPSCKVFDENMQEVGVGKSGMVGVAGYLPIGYYKDEAKSVKTFPMIDGVRYSIPGDWVRIEEDGSLTLLGRGSNCINTAGEKVYPEEVEEALKHHESVSDALVVGLPDDKWGQSVNAVVSLHEGCTLDEDALKVFIRKELAGYKSPKRILAKNDLERAPNGKANYKLIRTYVAGQLGVEI
ncbi:MAG: acyl-CoA synthetase [Pseudomonadota bacterium]